MASRRHSSKHHPTRRRRKATAARPSIYSPEIHEQRSANRYVARWHRVLYWVFQALYMQGFEEVVLSQPKNRERVEQYTVSCVRDLTDAEEAFERGIGLERLQALPPGPRRKVGGYRRVVVTALTWSIDPEGEVGYDPAWITLGHGMTGRQAAANAARFVRDYAKALLARVASRALIFTALEIKFWTARESSKYV